MIRYWPDKDPDEDLDYQVDWAFIATDTIDTSTWDIPSGLTSHNPTKTSLTATIWLAGGTEGETYEITNHIVTAGGRTFDQTVMLRCRKQ